MASSFRNITVDSGDAHALARFWAAVLGWNVYFDDDPEVLVAPTFPPVGYPTMLFIPVPEPRTVKNRVHLDLQPQEGTRDEEVERLVGLGATLVEDHRDDKGGGWVWLADPEGNDFCIERSAGERASAAKSRAFFLDERDWLANLRACRPNSKTRSSTTRRRCGARWPKAIGRCSPGCSPKTRPTASTPTASFRADMRSASGRCAR